MTMSVPDAGGTVDAVAPAEAVSERTWSVAFFHEYAGRRSGI
jgi:hypothetical protein